MKRGFSHQLMVVAGLLAGVCITTALPAQTADSQGFSKTPKGAPTVPGEAIYYYNGDSRVDLYVALDELYVKDNSVAKGTIITNTGAEADALDAGLKSVATNAKGDGNEYYLLVDPNANLLSLEENAAALRSLRANNGRTVRAVAYTREDSARGLSDKRIITNEFAVKLTGGQDVNALAKKYGASVVEKVDYSPDTYILTTSDASLLSALNAANAIKENESGIAFSEPQIARQQTPRLIPNDTLFTQQWHLKNTAQSSGGVAGNDVNIEGAWDTATGSGINIAITDDGVQVAHPDLSANCRTDIDKDFNGNDNDPSPLVSSDFHGSACAGVAAGKGNNSLGITGAGFNAGIVGVRLIAGATTDSLEAQGMAWQVAPALAADRVSINSNSWGPSDDGVTLETFGSLTKAAIENALLTGRGGKGTIYTWAAGNGRCADDSVSYDGYASSRYVVAVGATGANGMVSFYSEPGPAMLINAPSNYGNSTDCDFVNTVTGITTTDLTGNNGYNSSSTSTDYSDKNYTKTFGGTSSATPLAAGCISVILQANPNLGWRDVQGVLLTTATRNHPADAGWVQNGAGRYFNHAYGFGRINVSAATGAATAWVNYGPENVITFPGTAGLAIPDNNTTGVSNTININAPSNFVIEHVEVVLNATHTYRGDLGIELTAPSGMKSIFATEHGDPGDGYSNWIFTSVAHWGENPTGNWTLKVADLAALDTGTFTNWTLKVYGHLEQAAAPAITNITASTNDLSGWEMQGLGLLAVLPQAAGGTSFLQLPAGGNVGNFTGFTTAPALDFPTAIAGTPDPFDVTPGANRVTAAGTTSITMNAGNNSQGYLRFTKTVSASLAANRLLRFRVHLESAVTTAASKDDFKFGMGTLKTGYTNEFYSVVAARLFGDDFDALGREEKFFNPVPSPGSDFDSYLLVEAADTSIALFMDLQPTDSTASATSNDLKMTSWQFSSFDLGTNRANLTGKSVKLNRGNASLPALDGSEVLTPEPGATGFTFGPTTQGNAAGQTTGVGSTDNASLTQPMLSQSGTSTALSYDLNGPLVPNGASTFYPDFRAFGFYTDPAWLDIDHPTGGHFRAVNNKLYIIDVWASTTTTSSANLPQLRINNYAGFLDFNITSHFIQNYAPFNAGVAIGASPRAYSAVNKMQIGPAFASVPAFVNIEFLQPSLSTMNTLANVTIHRITVTEYNAP